ncbi:FAD:protein FMN transferase [Comamonas sp. GB3 AK4-5]|uniref:FAD:protein FMN transferase n=1 Tax=Comamonas sp. GB3 AK4-5 TaxID=3231487 RepID=UPI00351F2AE9
MTGSSTPRVSYAASLWKLPQAAPPHGVAGDFSQPGWGRVQLQHPQDARSQRLAGGTMGTTWSLRLSNPDFLPLEPVQAELQQVLDTVIAQMSNWEADSLISRYNAAPAGSVHALPAQFVQVLDAAMLWAQRSGGAMDPSMGGLVALWGFGPRAQPLQPHSGAVPSQAQIDALHAQSGHQRLPWAAGGTQLLQPGGVELDFCGIAKGFAVDAVVELLQAHGWRGGLFEIGGELRCWGQRPDGSPWRVQLASGPEAVQSPSVVSVQEGAFATSGDCWHQFAHGGRQYSHTLDPRTGWPVAHGLASVTVYHAACMHADALATVLTVLGPDEGMAFARQHGIAAVFTRHGPQAQPCATPAWRSQFGS